ncbi:hypothetical protein EPUL_003148 [Erysiphe pulchra]|uniref:GAG-pre-integrase domain-containing protein n=1 Tax=Erysiphe pulchra TaxID=225359 RepID=A0A2S4PSP1_9PEZI|nr:hypothetical protein EPUL_003148 [Erysiphe pulchra]
MGREENLVILGAGISFTCWVTNIQAALLKKKCLDHVFHDIEGIKSVTRPMWIEGEMTAKEVLATRMSKSMLPQSVKNMTAKQLFDLVAKSREEGATVPYQTAMRNLLNTNVNSSVKSMIPYSSKLETANHFVIPDGVASNLFIIGTESIEWLSTWRQTKVFDSSNHFVSIETIISTLRQAAAGVNELPSRATIMNRPKGNLTQNPRGNDPNERCELCKNPHSNSECYKQHPELAPKSKCKKKRGKKGKAKVLTGNDVLNEQDNYSDAGVSLASVAKVSSTSFRSKNPLLYDTGASHHFIPIGKSVLTYQGTYRLKVSDITLNLYYSFFSLNSACKIIYAVKLKNDHGIIVAAANKLLVQLKNNQPVDRLAAINGVLYIQPLKHTSNLQFSDKKTALGVARLPRTSDAHRWHQRLGHVEQRILKKIAEYSLGMEEVSFSDLSTCETCHLSKVQRYISREPRSVPCETLDEIFIDTVGKLTKSINGY